jgi:hypothetical protein
MAFTWAQTIAQRLNDERVDVQEIRDNSDWLHNNLAYCATHHTTHLTAYNASYCPTHYTTHLSSNLTTYLATHDASYCGTYLVTNLVPHYATNRGAHYGTHWNGFLSGDCGGAIGG